MGGNFSNLKSFYHWVTACEIETIKGLVVLSEFQKKMFDDEALPTTAEKSNPMVTDTGSVRTSAGMQHLSAILAQRQVDGIQCYWVQTIERPEGFWAPIKAVRPPEIRQAFQDHRQRSSRCDVAIVAPVASVLSPRIHWAKEVADRLKDRNDDGLAPAGRSGVSSIRRGLYAVLQDPNAEDILWDVYELIVALGPGDDDVSLMLE